MLFVCFLLQNYYFTADAFRSACLELDLDPSSHMSIGTMAQESAESIPVDEQSRPTDMDPEEIEDEELEEIRCVRMVLS